MSKGLRFAELVKVVGGNSTPKLGLCKGLNKGAIYGDAGGIS